MNFRNEIIGQWKLVKTIQYWPEHIEINYEDSVNVKTLDFNEKQGVRVYIPDEPDQICTWEFIKDSLRICEQWYLVKLTNDTLIISQSHVDGISEYFLKQNK